MSNYKYTLTNVNLRTEKSTKSDVIEVIPKNTKLEILDEEENWYKAIYNGKQGYIDRDYISISKYPWTNLKLRESESTSAKEILIIPKKSKVQVISTNGKWSKVIYDDKEGYVSNYYLSDDGNTGHSIDYSEFYKDMSKFINDNNIKSSSDFCVVTDLRNKYTYIFKKDNNIWRELYKWICTIGKPQTPTIKGTFYITGRKSGFGTDKYSVKYATRIKGAYYYHSILYNSAGTYVIDGRLGMALSHGCIRLETSNAKWIYENIVDGTTVIIH